MSAQQQDQMLEAFVSGGSEGLRDRVQQFLDQGVSSEVLLAELGRIRRVVSEDQEETVLDVVDLLVGWCAPSARLTAHTRESD